MVMNIDCLLKKFETLYAKKLIINQLGDEAEYYAENFIVTDFFKNKCYDLVGKNIDVIKNADVLDIGSNIGHWSTLLNLSGAKSVTSIEPRKQYVEGLNNFAKQEDLNINAVHGIHSDCFALGKKFDVVVLSALLPVIPDIFDFFNRLRSITDYVIILHHHTIRDVPDDVCKIEKFYNLSHRTAVDLRTKSYLENDNGNQYSKENFDKVDDAEGTVLVWYYGIQYIKTILEYLNYEIISTTEHKDGYLFNSCSDQRQDRVYYDLFIKNKNI